MEKQKKNSLVSTRRMRDKKENNLDNVNVTQSKTSQ